MCISPLVQWPFPYLYLSTHSSSDTCSYYSGHPKGGWRCKSLPTVPILLPLQHTPNHWELRPSEAFAFPPSKALVNSFPGFLLIYWYPGVSSAKQEYCSPHPYYLAKSYSSLRAHLGPSPKEVSSDLLPSTIPESGFCGTLSVLPQPPLLTPILTLLWSKERSDSHLDRVGAQATLASDTGLNTLSQG